MRSLAKGFCVKLSEILRKVEEISRTSAEKVSAMTPSRTFASKTHNTVTWLDGFRKLLNVLSTGVFLAIVKIQARKRRININFFVRLVPVFTEFVPGTNPVCPWDKSGEKLGQTQEFSLFYTLEARFHRVCPWDKPGLSLGQSGDEGRHRKFM